MRTSQALLLLVLLWLGWAAGVGVSSRLLEVMAVIGAWTSTAGLALELLRR